MKSNFKFFPFHLFSFFFVILFSPANVFGEEPIVEEYTSETFKKEEEKQLSASPIKDSEGKNYPLTWGEFDPGRGVTLGRNELGSMSLSFYVLARYINQQPPTQSYNDHQGRKVNVDARNDIELHRIMVWLKGNAYDPKLKYNINLWTVNSTKTIHTIGALSYNFDPKFNLAVGIDGNPAIRSYNGQHPYFLGTDRHLGDEFFKAGFTMGVSGFGQLSKNVFYRAMIGNSFSEIGLLTSQMTRNMAYGASVWVLPTGEFGPRGGYGDYEMHSDLSSRFGISAVQSRESANAQPDENNEPQNTTIRLSDGQNFFSPGALAPGVQIKKANATIMSVDGALKYRGFFLDANYYWRWLSGFKTDGGRAPQNEIFDNGYMVQAGYQIIPRKVEIYTAYSYIFGEFNNPWEIAVGGNYYPKQTRNWRLNMMVNHVEQSPVNSQFGYYIGGQTGETLVLATDLLF
jgi:hypothetical protein